MVYLHAVEMVTKAVHIFCHLLLFKYFCLAFFPLFSYSYYCNKNTLVGADICCWRIQSRKRKHICGINEIY